MAKESLLKSDLPNKQYQSCSRLYENSLDSYQRHAVDFCLKTKTSALFLDQGTGKTWIAATVIESLPTGPYLIVVPLSNKVSTWQTLLTKELPHIPYTSDFAEFKKHKTGILVVHYEELRAITPYLAKIKWKLIVFDESQKLKQRTSLQSRNASRLRDSAEYKIIMSGTPMDDRPIDLWAQFRFLRPEIFGTRWADFEDRFLEPLPSFPQGIRQRSFKFALLMRNLSIRRRKRKFDYSKLPEFLNLISPYCFRKTQADVLDLDPIIYQEVIVPMLGKHREAYDQLRRNLVLELKDKTVTAPMKAVLVGRLHQICGGFLKDEDGDAHLIGRAKLRKLKTLIKPHCMPIVIFCNYTAEAEAIAQELAPLGRVALLTGKTKQKARPGMQQDFQSGLIDILVCQIRTGGVGIDLFASNHAIIYSFRHSYIDFDQAVKRLQRRGQKRQVRIILLLASNSIDIDVKEAVFKKRNVTEYVLSRIQEKENS